ncbi:MAG: hypothetical protein AAGA66_17440 [Bacteroidota bacterium]
MVEVFKTDIGCREKARQVCYVIECDLKHKKATVDLQDCDKILRVESDQVMVELVKLILKHLDVKYEHLIYKSINPKNTGVILLML